jgi:predicted transcriptional regulator
MSEEMYTCPKCGRISHNPNDALNRYCGYCHIFEEQEAEFIAAIEEGLKALGEGRVLSHEEVKARFENRSY